MSFLFGVILLRFLLWPMPFWLLAGLLGVAAAVCWRWPMLRPGGRLLLVALAGWTWAGIDAQDYQARVLPSVLEGQDLIAHGRVLGLADANAERVRFRFAIESLQAEDGQGHDYAGTARLYWYGADPAVLAPGRPLALSLRLKRPHGMVNPGGFDYEAWLFSRDIHATGYVRRQLAEPAGVDAPIGAQIHHRWRWYLAERLQRAATDRREIGLIKALVIGDRSGLEEADWRLFRRTGTSHLMAISGLHIGLLAIFGAALGAGLWRCLSPLQARLPRQHTKVLLAWLAALLYAALAGFSLPTQRALLMLSVGLLALLLRRRLRAGQALGAALLLVLIADPAAPLDAGFWLSFLAVAIILWRVAGRSGRRSGVWHWLGLQFALVAAMIPAGLIWFQQASLIAPLANAIAIPWIGFAVVPLSMLGTGLLAVVDHDLGLLWLADQLLIGLRWILAALAEPEWLQWRRGGPAWPALLAVAGGLAWLLAPRGVPARWLGLALCVPALLAGAAVPGSGHFRVVLFDVGQGLSALVQTRSHSLLFDTGPASGSGFVAARSSVIPSLRDMGIGRLDRVIVSHADRDHAGGLAAIVEALAVDGVQTAVPDQLEFDAATACRGGERWTWDGVGFEVLAPVEPLFADDNDDSCVLRIGNAAGRVLLTGDIGKRAEQRLIDAATDVGAEVLVAGHHGSNTSTGSAWLQAVAPRWVLYAAGYRNRYGFPHPAVRERVARFGASGANTADHGAIRIDFGGADGRARLRATRHDGEYWRVDQPPAIHTSAVPRPRR